MHPRAAAAAPQPEKAQPGTEKLVHFLLHCEIIIGGVAMRG
jgi:hypothetical protein